MIEIHRSQPVAQVGVRTVPLTRDEHQLLTALGMLDNKIAPFSLLLEVMCEGRVQIPADRDVLWVKLSRLRHKIGVESLKCRRGIGYRLVGPVRFVG